MSNQPFPQNSTLLIVNGVVAGLSLIGELYVVITYFRYKKYFKGGQMQLVLYLITADIVESISDLGFFYTGTSAEANSNLCIANGFVRLFGLICSVMWVAIISRYSVILVEGESEKTKSFKSYAFISLLVPAISCVIPLYGTLSDEFPGYDYDLIGCLGDPGTLLCVLYPPVIFAFGFIIYNFRKVKAMRDSENGEKISSFFKYPIFLILCWIPGLITRIVMVIYGPETPLVLEALLIAGLHSMGLTNGIFYGYAYRNILKDRINETKLVEPENVNPDEELQHI